MITSMFASRGTESPGIGSANSTPDVFEGILDCIGNTPLVHFERYLDRDDVALHVKLEAANPGGSAKDRPALQMLKHALAQGDLHSGSVVVESSSGNMGIGLSQACRFFGLKFICIVDPHAQAQNVAIMKALGATIEVVTEPIDDSFLAARLQRVQHLLKEHPHGFWPNQYANRQNPLAHEQGTIREIDAAMNGEIDYLFVAASSTGTIQGCRDYLRKRGRSTRVIAVDAHGSVLFGGTPGPRLIPGLGAGCEPPLARDQVFDGVVRVSDLDCVIGCRRAALREATLVGGSAGGVLETVRSLQDDLAGKRCVAILHDSGTRYLETVFNDDWVKTNCGASPADLAKMMERPALSASRNFCEVTGP